MFQNLVQARYLGVGRLHSRYLANNPFPHLALRDFFNKKQIKKVARALQKQPFTHKETDLFSLNQTNDLAVIRNKTLKQFYNFCNSKDFLAYISVLTGMKVKGINMSSFIYKDGDYLLPHDDRLERRKVAYIINLTKGYTRKSGGALSLFETKGGEPTRIIKSYIPYYNTLTLFTVSKKSFHQVNEILTSKPRLSIGGWFY